MIDFKKTSTFCARLAASAGAAFVFGSTLAHADYYEISVGEDTSGPTAPAAYSNGIIKDYSTPIGEELSPASQAVDVSYSSAINGGINGVPGDYHVYANLSLAHGGTLHAFASGDGGFSGESSAADLGPLAPPEGSTEASASLAYNFELIGPASATPIPVTFNGEAYTTTVGTGVASGYLRIYDDPNAEAVDWELAGESSFGTGPAGETIKIKPNTLYAVFASVTAYGHVPYADGPFDPSQDSGYADAYVDPTLTLTGQYASLYHFEGIPAAPLASGVPEPSTWAMLLVGFAGLGYAGYRRSAVSRQLQAQPFEA